MILEGLEIRISLIDLNLQSLKEKRSIIKSMLEKTHRRYNVSIVELDDFDSLDFAIIGIASLDSRQKHLDARLTKCIEYMESNFPIEIIDIIRQR